MSAAEERWSIADVAPAGIERHPTRSYCHGPRSLAQDSRQLWDYLCLSRNVMRRGSQAIQYDWRSP